LPERAPVRITVLDVAGRSLRVDDLGARNAGELRWALPGVDASGRPWATGIYFVRVEAGSRSVTRRWVVLAS